MKFAQLAFPVVFLALTNQAYALCKVGTIVNCTINGKAGTKECFGAGFGPCEPTGGGTPPANGTVNLKYYVLTVIYAPPGTKGGSSTSSVSYGSDSTTGTTTTSADSYKQDYSVTATISGGFLCTGDKCTIGVGGGASYEYSMNETNSTALDIKKTTTSTILVNGPNVDGVDHDLDTIWLLLRPKVDVSILGKSVQWTFDNTNADPTAANIPIYVYVDHLKNPDKMQSDAPGTFRPLQAAGITTQDFPDILKADPLAACQPPVVKPALSRQRIPLPGQRIPLPGLCSPFAPGGPRFVSAYVTLPYEPPHDAGSPVPVQTFSVDNSAVSTHTGSTETTNKVGATAEGSLNFLTVWKASVKSDNSWTWTNTNTTATSTGSTQKMSLTMGGPAFGYSGPIDMAVYYDTLYQTFVFWPFDIPSGTLRGVVMNSAGKPIAGQEVIAFVGGVKYRTYTNVNGEYRFPSKFVGPINLQAGAVSQRLPRVEPGKSIDFRL